ncbi:MAG: glycosyltransferase family 4 protein [Candidatus Omnitrophica bacterium]|jgi:glycosyltransferase involved in cell wall biosynthesis|nr:glycosyltransferase family 4 protein [Candidatus Omnitrophota bacterium]MDD5078099.1 glycosyltransferase family 4 protein [Candidatus Omnitrophota bacterium]
MPKINLLYVVTKLELGGAQRHVLSLIRGLDKVKYNVCLFTSAKGLLINEASSIEGLSVKRSNFLERPVNPFKDILALVELYFFIRKHKIDIVHTHSSKAGILGRLAARFAGARVILHTVHGWSFHNFQPAAVSWFYVLCERLCACFTDRIIVVSVFDREKGLEHGVGKSEQYRLVRYGIDVMDFRVRNRRFRMRESLELNNTDPVVGMVACFKPQKAPLDFIELASLVRKDFPEVKFILVGDGRLSGKIFRRIKQLGIEKNMILSGWRRDIPMILSGLDVFVLTSLWEGVPIVALEAMAASVPLVVTDTGGIKEVITDGENGYLVEPRDIHSMHRYLVELLSDPRKRRDLAGRAAEDISSEEFSAESMLKKVFSVYDSLLGAAGNV